MIKPRWQMIDITAQLNINFNVQQPLPDLFVHLPTE